MPRYKYTAYDFKGQQVLGERVAQNPEALKMQLKNEKLTLKNFSELKGNGEKKELFKFGSKSIREVEKINFTREIGIMLESGLSLLGALGVQENMVKKKFLKEFVASLRETINRGGTLYGGFIPYKQYFGDIYINLVRVGEVSGTLGKTMLDLSELLEKNDEIKKKVKSAMIYPAVVLFITFCISGFLVIYVLPNFVKMFTDSGVKLPFITQFLLDISVFVREKSLFVIAAVFLLIFLIRNSLKTRKGKIVAVKLIYNIPLIGDLMLKSVALRFSRTLSTLLESGITVLKSFEISSLAVGDPVFEDKMKKAGEDIQSGGKIANALNSTGYFSIAAVTMVAVGEESGEIIGMLKKIADYNERQLNQVIRDTISLIEPIMMVILGVVVGTIVIAIYLPMFDMISTIK